MKLLAKLVAGSILLTSLVSLASAAGVEGRWNGQMQMPNVKPKTEQDKKMMEQMKTFLKQMKFSIELKADKTFFLMMTLPKTPKSPADKAKVDGTWSMSGNKIVLVTLKENGRDIPRNKQIPQTLVVAKDGKTMTMTPKGTKGGSPASVLFSR